MACFLIHDPASQNRHTLTVNESVELLAWKRGCDSCSAQVLERLEPSRVACSTCVPRTGPLAQRKLGCRL